MSKTSKMDKVAAAMKLIRERKTNDRIRAEVDGRMSDSTLNNLRAKMEANERANFTPIDENAAPNTAPEATPADVVTAEAEQPEEPEFDPFEDEIAAVDQLTMEIAEKPAKAADEQPAEFPTIKRTMRHVEIDASGSDFDFTATEADVVVRFKDSEDYIFVGDWEKIERLMRELLWLKGQVEEEMSK